ncbi:MAG: nucleotidyltransferase substrate binding protein [Cytophagaceae bacterium]|nr:nucleotidyltransferase substrate binding protein [Cytophagaceae bacterium]
MAWKCLKLVLEERGVTPINSPKVAFTQGYLNQLLDNEPLWLAILAYRNKSVHTYDHELAEVVFERIPEFYRAMHVLLVNLQQES